jgi:uncharacterized protein YcbX
VTDRQNPSDLSNASNVSIAALHLYPIKSCAGVAVDEGLLIETGLQFDRAWMVTDASGGMITQRQQPRLALARLTLRDNDLVLRAPGMLALHVSLDAVEAPTRARVWKDEVKAYDMGALAAQWFSDFLGQPARLCRFDPGQKRLANPAWTGDVAAEIAFADGYPLLVIGSASLDDLNRRLAARGADAVTMARLRPNLVLDGLQPYDEDHLDELRFDAEEGPVRLKLVKPCTRCAIPDIDPETAAIGTEPGATLAGYRADARVGGAISFGMNAIVLEGIDCVLRAGQVGTASWKI